MSSDEAPHNLRSISEYRGAGLPETSSPWSMKPGSDPRARSMDTVARNLEPSTRTLSPIP